MNSIEEWAKGCLRKKKYPTKETAKVYKYKVENKYGYTVRVYKCSHCDGYHLTKDNNE